MSCSKRKLKSQVLFTFCVFRFYVKKKFPLESGGEGRGVGLAFPLPPFVYGTDYVYIFCRVWIFVQAVLIKTTLFKQDQKESKSKAKKIIVQGNLKSSFVFLF